MSKKWLFLLVVALGTMCNAQAVQPVSSSDQVAVSVGRSPALASGINWHNTVEKVARHCQSYAKQTGHLWWKRSTVDQAACAADPSTVFFRETSPNMLMKAGWDVIARQVSNAPSGVSTTAVCNFIALTNTAITPANTDTTLSGEIAVNGLGRVQATTLTHSAATATYVMAKTFTATGAQSAQAAAVFDAVSTGNMCFENTFTQVTLALNDTLTISWTITIS